MALVEIGSRSRASSGMASPSSAPTPAPAAPAAATEGLDGLRWDKYSPDLVLNKPPVGATGGGGLFGGGSSSSSKGADGGGLSIRKLTFGRFGSASSDAPSSSTASIVEQQPAAQGGAGGAGGAGGLPSLLKKLKQDAQEEILKATAHVRQIVNVFRRELMLLEREASVRKHCHQSNVGSLCVEVEALEGQRRELVHERRELLAAKAELEGQKAALEREVVDLKEEARRAHERADAMEAASVFLQARAPRACINDPTLPCRPPLNPCLAVSPQADETDVTQIRSTGDAMLGTADEARKGARNTFGMVALANVPALNGGFPEELPQMGISNMYPMHVYTSASSHVHGMCMACMRRSSRRWASTPTTPSSLPARPGVNSWM